MSMGVKGTTKHGSTEMFKRGCRCADCKHAGVLYNQKRANYRSPKFQKAVAKITRWRCGECGQLNDTTRNARCGHPNPWEPRV